MNRSRHQSRIAARVFFVAIALIVVPLGTAAADPAGPVPATTHYDVRVHAPEELARLAEGAVGKTVAEIASDARDRRLGMQLAASALREQAPGVEITLSPLVGGAEVVRSARGIPLQGDSVTEGVERFFRTHAALYGLNVHPAARLEILGESVSRASGLRAVRLRQLVHGVPVFQSETWATVDRNGRLVRTVGRIVPGSHGTPRVAGGWPAPERRPSCSPGLSRARHRRRANPFDPIRPRGLADRAACRSTPRSEVPSPRAGSTFLSSRSAS